MLRVTFKSMDYVYFDGSCTNIKSGSEYRWQLSFPESGQGDFLLTILGTSSIGAGTYGPDPNVEIGIKAGAGDQLNQNLREEVVFLFGDEVAVTYSGPSSGSFQAQMYDVNAEQPFPVTGVFTCSGVLPNP